MITIINYDAGNIRSVQRACSEIGVSSVIASQPKAVLDAERIIFPGIGAAKSAMQYMRKTKLDAAFRHAFENGVPILGICLGAQIILESSEEGNQTCLGLIPGKTLHFKFSDISLKIPHIGWNGVRVVQPHPLLDGVSDGDEFYFIHSFYPQPAGDNNIYAVTHYGDDFCSALGRRNLFATQFHPEKSGRFGLRLLERFARWNGVISTESAKSEKK